MKKAIADYAREVSALVASKSTIEPTYYPAIRALLTATLKAQQLPFEVRTQTSESRAGAKGADLPDIAMYDGIGDFAVVFVEAKLPSVELQDLAASQDNEDQIGRYLAQTSAIVITNVRGFALVTKKDSHSDRKSVPPSQRRIEQHVELWSSVSVLKSGAVPADDVLIDFTELVETAVTRYAPIAEPESLARILARHARRAKADLPERFTQAVKGLLDDFSKALGITFGGPEGEEFLRSSLIQTAFYGLFAGWALWRRSGESKPFAWEDLGRYLKIPFLGQLFHEFRHPTRLDELRLASHLDLATEALGRVDLDRFFARFRVEGFHRDEPKPKKGRHVEAAAITYFYEPFLEAFDPQLRKELGVWYTPPEVVRYQVRRVDEILRIELNRPRGFADDDVVVLDPCCGTGAYLIEVLHCIAGHLEEDGVGDLLGAKLLQALHTRVIGFEILTAPFVVAQLQMYLMLAEIGAEPTAKERPAIFLTNALAGWEGRDQIKLHFPEMQEEHDAARQVKQDAKIIVILGNPPYNRFAGAPIEEEADLVDHYKGIKRDKNGKQNGHSALFTEFGVRKHLLDDLYIRFFRLAEQRIGEKAEYGVVSFISNSSFLSGRSHPVMRRSLVSRFHEIWIDNLNGDKYRTGKVVPKGQPGAGTSDQSVFTTEQDPRGIQVGASITTMVKRRLSRLNSASATVHYRDLWGKSADKRRALLESIDIRRWSNKQRAEAALRPEGPREFESFVPTESNRWKLTPLSTQGGYESWPSLDELFPSTFQGVNPNRGIEGSVVDCDDVMLKQRMHDFFSDLPVGELRERHPVLCDSYAGYDVVEVRRALRANGFQASKVQPYVVFPLDLRWIYYETEWKLLNRPRPEFWKNLSSNEFLVAVPQPRRVSEARPLFATGLVDLHLHDRGSVCFPATVRPATSPDDLFESGADVPAANLAEPVWSALSKAWRLLGSRTDAAARTLVSDLFRVALAILHAPAYEADHAEALAQDWARLPIPRDRKLFSEVAEVGAKLRLLLDPMADARATISELLGVAAKSLGVVEHRGDRNVRAEDLALTVAHFGAARGGWRARDPRPEDAWRPEWGTTTGDLSLNATVFLRNIPERVWTYELGGYPVVKKWLGYREARRRDGSPLTLAEVDHLRGIVHRIATILALHVTLDQLYERVADAPFTAEELGM